MDKKQWDEIYKKSMQDEMPDPAAFLREQTSFLSGGTALDIAAGAGQNAVFLAKQGYDVVGIDRSSSAVALMMDNARRHGVCLTAFKEDALNFAIPENSFDLIADFYFLERNLFPAIKTGLKKGGLLFFETYTREQQQFDGPHNPAFLLDPNELLLSFLDLFVLFYHERIDTAAGKPRAIASLLARKV